MRRYAILILCSLVIGNVWAWDTLVNEEGDKGSFSWKSLYQQADANQAAAQYRGAAKKPAEETAEHTRLADMALERLGVAHMFSRQGLAEIKIIDLNVNLFRIDDMDGLPTEGDDPDTAIEERLIVTPAHFSGMPDYSYTIYDWLNKNQYCPPSAAPEVRQKCHVFFMGWLGNLNSTHFGTQAKNMYERYHRIARQLANRAKYLNKSTRNQGGVAAFEAYKPFIKEAEIEALAYEGYAQHFLQDRWAIGHMWERWGTGNYDRLPSKKNIDNTLLGIVAGMLHGSEAVLNKTYSGVALFRSIATTKSDWVIDRDSIKVDPSKVFNTADPLSSPLIIDKNTAMPLTWKHKNGRPVGGVGDLRLTDMEDGKFGADYIPYEKDFDIDVSQQQKEMLRCSMAGWAEIIRKLGKQNAHEATLQNDPGFDVLNAPECWDMWATNNAIRTGITKDSALNYSVVGRLAFGAPDGLVEKGLSVFLRNSTNLGKFNKSLIQMLYRIDVATIDQPDGSSLAQGGIGKIFDTETGNQYDLPDYAEPGSIDKLPDRNEQGRDKETLFGAFSRAHSDHWCSNIKTVFTKYELRGSQEEKKQEICMFLADLAFDGTDRFYDGEQKEKRKAGGKVIPSMCTIRNQPVPAPVHPFATLRDQGFVPYGKYGKPQDKTDNGMTYKSVEYWCKKVPTITLPTAVDKADLRNRNIVAEAPEDEDALDIEGFNFGDDMGKIHATDEDSREHFTIPTNRWAEHRIELDIANANLRDGQTYLLEVETAPDENGKQKASVGLFRLKIKPAAKIVIKNIDLKGLGPCRTNLDSIKTVDIIKSLPKDPSTITAKYLGKLGKAYESYHKDIAETLDAQADCMEELLADLGSVYTYRLKSLDDFSSNFVTGSFYKISIGITRNTANYVRQIDWEIRGWEAVLKDKKWFYMPTENTPFGVVTESEKYTYPLNAANKAGFDLSKLQTDKMGVKMFINQFADERKKTIGNSLKQRFDYLEILLKNTVDGLTSWTQIENQLHQQLFPALVAHLNSLPKVDEYGHAMLVPVSVYELYGDKFRTLAGGHIQLANMDSGDFSGFLLYVDRSRNSLTRWPGRPAPQPVIYEKTVYEGNEIRLRALDSQDDFGFGEAQITPQVEPMPEFTFPELPSELENREDDPPR